MRPLTASGYTRRGNPVLIATAVMGLVMKGGRREAPQRRRVQSHYRGTATAQAARHCRLLLRPVLHRKCTSIFRISARMQYGANLPVLYRIQVWQCARGTCPVGIAFTWH